METTQMVSNPTDVTPALAGMAATAGTLRLATVWIDLKPERVQDTLTADDTATVSLGLSIDQPQTVTFVRAGAGLAVTFGSPAGNPAGSPTTSGTPARAAA